ncbi:hypothetical protein Q73A0000_16415 [Kaistella flava (ex Peng et al. 2021)]|uniref:Uncharacterized protein n=1 Tax=Kaistella flava (ex Peng et al. 2021) TaxID=2038776 RepID=A0A7M2YDD6_9FLAO|nr:hypothetical protein [Kaistella flava (ex Peng et al. 2021)]QOW11829.1 hypothetical protein Q73A0000_16415 [Kaistella flava (ex Peng et al. 2021)]
MIKQKGILKSNSINDTRVVERLIALWALNECTLGGIMHAFKLPFTGIFVGGISVLLITLIALSTTKTWSTLLKALTIVLVIKVGISPYTPITAYFAVSFQAFLGILLYTVFSVNSFTIIVLCAVTFLESALQKLLTLTLVFGQSFWKAVDVYMDWISQQLSFLPIVFNSKSLIYTFLGIYVLSGIAAGFLIIRTIKLIKKVNVSQVNLNLDTALPEFNSNKKKFKKKIFYSFLIILVIVLIPILYFNNGSQAWQNALYLIIRSVLILMIWYFLLGPYLINFLNKILSEKREFYQTDVQDILTILPILELIIYHSWKESKTFKGFNRLIQFLAKSIAYSLYFEKIKK